MRSTAKKRKKGDNKDFSIRDSFEFNDQPEDRLMYSVASFRNLTIMGKDDQKATGTWNSKSGKN